ncbi:protein kinase [Rhodobacterales bacterium HKCCE2091]|nr:protein kinase [Rhodobacterales bacterium HKCCE2091]
MSDAPTHTRPLPEPPAGELPIGTVLNGGQYKIARVIASGGFGITYLANDNLGRDVALKECFPAGLAMRSSGRSVSAASSSTADSFETARNLFLREARLLAGLMHPNVVHVQTLFEENGTAYMAMDFIHGHDLHEYISTYPDRLTPPRVMELARTLLNGLDYIHGEDLLHRDIKPSNIRIDRFGTPILIDFGAARQQTQQASRLAGSFRVVSDGYSPNEFYIMGAPQGPGSDLYSLAATLYHVISGSAPPPSDMRANRLATGEPDPLEPLSGRFPEQDPRLLAQIDKSMNMSLKDRPKSAAEWLAAIPEITPQPTRAAQPAQPAQQAATLPVPVPESSGSTGKGALLGAVATAAVAAVLFFAVPGVRGAGGDGAVSQQQFQAAVDAREEAETARAAAIAAERTASDRAEELETQLGRAQADLDTANARLAELSAGGDGPSQAELDRAITERDDALARVRDLQSELTTLRSDNSVLSNQNDRLQDEIDSLQAQLDAALANGGGGGGGGGGGIVDTESIPPVTQFSGIGNNVAPPANCPNPSLLGDPRTVSANDLFTIRSFGSLARGTVGVETCTNLPNFVVGLTNAAPNFTFTVTDATAFNRLQFEVESNCDPTILVRSADGQWFFSDDRPGSLNPRLHLVGSGRFSGGPVDVWIGTFNTDACPATLSLRTFVN